MDSLAPTADDERLAILLHALGNPMRLAILHYITNHPGCICNDLVLRFDRAQATVSQHLAMLRKANVLVAERDGQATCYWVDAEQISWLQRHIARLTDGPKEIHQ